MRVSLPKTLLFAALAGALLALLSACGDGDETGTSKVQAGPTIVIQITPYPTISVPEGPLPTRATDFATACQKSDQKQWEEMPPMIIDPSLSYTAVIRTEKGDITLKLYPDVAPITVNNFVFLACNGFYDDLTFHRVVPDFVAQAGDPTGQSIGGPGYYIPTEISDRGFLRGTVGMSSRGLGTPTNGSQFFICYKDLPELDGQYTVFGEVVDGFEVLEQLTPRRPEEHGPPGDTILEITVQEG